jgi:hypothetical protein
VAEESYREHIEAKRYAHLGNENFVSRLYPKRGYSHNMKTDFQFKRRVSQPVTQSVRTVVRHVPSMTEEKPEISP